MIKMRHLKRCIYKNFNKAKNMYFFFIRNAIVSACGTNVFTLQHLYTYIRDIFRQISFKITAYN